MTTNTRPEPGEQIHFRESGFTFAVSEGYSGTHVSRRGQTITVTAALIEASVDRNGDSWLDLVDDELGQIERWGSVQFGRGPFPEDEPLYVRGTVEWADARAAANKRAHSLPDGPEKAAAFREVFEVFGPGMPTSRTLKDYDKGREQGDEILRRAKAAQGIIPDTSRAAEAQEVLLYQAEQIRRSRALAGEEV
jgi:hypothetical protein